MTTTVVHCKKSSYDIYIGRPSKWGNPYSHKEGTLANFKVGSVEEAVESYESYLLNSPELLNSIGELKDKVLGCWCKFTGIEPCHGDILAKYADK